MKKVKIKKKLMEIHQFLHHAMPPKLRCSRNNGLKATIILGMPQPSGVTLSKEVCVIYLFIYFFHFSDVAKVAIIH
jgi:hypothetical protein